MKNDIIVHDSDFINPYPPFQYVICFLITTILSIFTISISFADIGESLNIDSDISFIGSMLIGLPCFMFVNLKIAWGHLSYIIILKLFYGITLLLTLINTGVNFTTIAEISNEQYVRLISVSVSIIVLFILYSETYCGFVTYRKHHIRVMYKLRDGKPLEEIKVED
ncbi:hypothetical protein MSP8887_04094 [Marinomonas spartinae]|uniref:Uncharacterized protein n=1 Tax=Marinomonas spartinae TaxID=1792290 RepID=A0A1A8T3R8_9GAMM|nr:hypothetical protein [Marinomonas spartinae]SBS26073.1 hypothetical protein MSP8886_00489 [Marinomonas spartinae]SBS39948.1 hypothetical protein MSP8887_04094 [Marinomonas spartinae]